MSKVKNENYVLVQGWMINELNLKGNSLLIYAIIYGFSQEESHRFTGSLQYLADWTSSTKQGVTKCLKFLVEHGYISKEEKIVNGVKFCEYYTTKLDGGIQLSLTGGMQQSLPNNIDINNKEYIVEIVEYLNSKANTSYKHSTKNTIDCINARLNEGYTVDDFKTVIDKKCDEWIGTDMEKFIRPQTLFGTKFENYLNQKVVPKEPKKEKPKYDYQYL